jgi:hypothetical protein
MTFEEFQATRRPSENLSKDLPGVYFYNDDPISAGFIYLNSLYIEDVHKFWPETAKREGKYYLLLERSEWISNDLADLERKLYDFAIDNGYAEET